MEDNLEEIVADNVEQFKQYSDQVKSKNSVLDQLRADLGRARKQHFEMENINECLEQRIDQLRAQRELSVQLAPAGLEQDLQAELQHSDAQGAKLVALLSNTELAWEDTLFIKMRALEDKVRQQSDATVTRKVAEFLK